MKRYKLYYALAKDKADRYVSLPLTEERDRVKLKQKLHDECTRLTLYPTLTEDLERLMAPSHTLSMAERPILFRLLLIEEATAADTATTKVLSSMPDLYIIYSATLDGQTTQFFDERARYKSLVGESVNVKSIINLFQDYARPRFGWFLSCHWNRHHYADAQTLITELNETAGDIQIVLDKLVTLRQSLLSRPSTNHAGSFMRRLDFAIYTLAAEDAEPGHTSSHHRRATTSYSMPAVGEAGEVHARGASGWHFPIPGSAVSVEGDSSLSGIRGLRGHALKTSLGQ